MSLLDDLENPKALRGKSPETSNSSDARAFKKATRLTSAGYLKQTQSGKPEAMLKVTSFARGFKVKVLMEYVARTDKEDLALEDEKGASYENAEQIKELHDRWKNDFERAAIGTSDKMKAHEERLAKWEEGGRKGKKPRTPKGAPRHATHIILSASAENNSINQWRTENAARAILDKNFGQAGYEYIFVTHKDTDNPHVHVVIKNHNHELNKKLRLDKNDLFALRQDFAKELQLQGIQQSATLRQDRPYTLEQMTKNIEELNNKQTWFQSKIKTNKSPQIDLDNILRQQTRKIAAIEKKVKKANIPLKAKDNINKQLRELKLEIVNSKENNIEKLLASKVKALGGDTGYIKSGIKELADIKVNQPSLSPAGKKEQKLIKQRVQKFIDSKNKEIRLARKQIKDSKLNRNQKKPLLDGLAVLDTQIKQYSKSNGIDSSKENKFMNITENKSDKQNDNLKGLIEQLDNKDNDKDSPKHKMIVALKNIEKNLKKATDPTLTVADRAEAYSKGVSQMGEYAKFKKQAMPTLSTPEKKALKNIDAVNSKLEKTTFSDIKAAARKEPNVNNKQAIKNITRLHNNLDIGLAK